MARGPASGGASAGTGSRSRSSRSPPAPPSRCGSPSRSTGRLPEQVEVAAYYVVCESLANIGKHAHATSATVDVARTNGTVVVEVVDDGVGGADTRARLRPPRPCRPRRGARGRPARLDPAGRRHAGQGGDPMRVAIAEDSVLLRDGLARLLDDAGFDVVAQCGDADELLLQGEQPPAGRRDRRHPPAAHPQRRGPAGGARDPRRTIPRSGCSSCRSTSSSGSR